MHSLCARKALSSTIMLKNASCGYKRNCKVGKQTWTCSCARLARVQSTAGANHRDEALARILAGADFDPDKYDAAMAAAFGDEYYQA